MLRKRMALGCLCVLLGALQLVSAATALAAGGAYQLMYEGRLVAPTGRPYQGSAALRVDFFHESDGGDPVLTVTSGLESVPLSDAGLFQLRLQLTADEFAKVFPDVSQTVFVSITDLSHEAAQPLGRQQVMMMPYAGKVPVDGKTVRFGPDGRLTVGPQSRPRAGEFLTIDQNGEFSWATPGLGGGADGGTIQPSGVATPNTKGRDLVLSAGPGTGQGGSGDVIFQTAEPVSAGMGASTPSARMTITATGEIGIGTTEPESLLQVSGGQVSMAIPQSMMPTGTTQIVDWNDGNIQNIDLSRASGDVTLTLLNPVAGATYALKVSQGANGRNLIWPAAVKWPSGVPTVITATVGAMDLITLLYDGTRYLAFSAKDFR